MAGGLIVLGFGIAFLVAGLAALYLAGIGMLATHLAASSWPVTEGHVREASLQLSQGGGRTGGPVERLTVSYDYTVDGRAFVGRRASLRDTAEPDQARLRGLHRRLDAARLSGGPVPVHYRPEEAYLDIALPRSNLIVGLVLGTAFALFGMLLLIGAWRSLRRR